MHRTGLHVSSQIRSCMHKISIIFACFSLAACATTPVSKTPTVQYYLSTSQPACQGLGDCQTRCDQQENGRACLEWALYALTATASETDVSKALEDNASQDAFAHAAQRLAQSCENNDPLSCLDLGNLHLQGLGVPLDQARAIAHLTTACDHGVADSCTRLGVLFQEGVAVAADALHAERLFRIGCNAGHTAACSLLTEQAKQAEP